MPYKLLEISSPSDLDAFADWLEDAFEPAFVICQLKTGLDPCCRLILLESEYNDRDYRSTYYHYYAKKGRRYEMNCVRLHFFDDRVQLRAGLELFFDIDNATETPSDTYFGYMVLRPTRENTIGRTVMAPEVIRGFQGCVIEAEHQVHVLGHTLVVRGFPYMSQHADISVCAHAACWGILRHYSERFPRYAEFLTYDITRMAHEFDPGGLIPSKGLFLSHAERIFARAGTYPVLIPRYGAHPNLFYRQMFAYVESGFPLFAELRHIDHAVAIVGHTGFGEVTDKSAPCHFACDGVRGLVVVDDNFLPYRVAPLELGDPYSCCDITAIIVPLPEKIYYSAECVDTLAITLATRERFGFSHEALGKPMVRYFLTTASHLRRFTNKHRGQFNARLAAAVTELALPQFVWIIEIASEAQWTNGAIATRVVADATASPAEDLPIFLMHNSKKFYVCDRGGNEQRQYREFASPSAETLSRMTGNLEIHPSR